LFSCSQRKTFKGTKPHKYVEEANMNIVNNLLLGQFGDSLLSQILLIILVILSLIVVYLFIKRFVPKLRRMEKEKERREITELRRKEKKLLTKLTTQKKDAESKLKRLKSKK